MITVVFWFFIVLMPGSPSGHVFTYTSYDRCRDARTELVSTMPVDYMISECTRHPREELLLLN